MKITQLILGLSCLAIAGPSAAAEEVTVPKVSWKQSPIVVMPGLVTAEERKVKDNEVFIKVPLRWVKSTRLEQDVSLVLGDKTGTISAGEHLPYVIVNTGRFNIKRYAYCTRSKVAENQEGTGLAGFLVGPLLNGSKDDQICLEDNDNDKKFDKAFMIGDSTGIVELGDFEKVPYTELEFENISEEDFVKISLFGIGKSKVKISVDLMQRGRNRRFTNWSSGRFYTSSFFPIHFSGKKKRSATSLGINIDVVEANNKEKWAVLRWKPVARAKDMMVVPDTVNTYMRY